MPHDWDTGLEKRGRNNGQLVPDSCLRLKAMGAGMYGTVRHFSLLKSMRKINPFPSVFQKGGDGSSRAYFAQIRKIPTP
jgi:hypothetical protein